jgi:molybdenum cofactor guanylyltransferase
MDGSAADVTAFILAGGKSARMGSEKAFVLLGGQTLLERALAVARAVTDEVRIVGETKKFQEFAPVVEDLYRGCGPLAGIHAALRASQRELNVILAVDLPLVTKDLLQYLLARARSSDVTVTAARAGGGWQPLCAVYRREFAYAAEKALQQGQYKIDALFSHGRVQPVEEKELQAAGFSAEMFRNLNTAEELAAAETLATQDGTLRARSQAPKAD